MSDKIVPVPQVIKPTEQKQEQHVYHHYDNDGARVSVKVEKNTKGFNYEASVSGAKSVAEAILLLEQTEKELKALYGTKEEPKKDELPF